MKKEISVARIEALSEHSPILFYDGVCGLCDAFVRFMIRHDKEEIFKLASLQSEVGKKISQHLNIENDLDTVIGLSKSKYTTESDVILMVADELGGWWSIIKVIKIVPKVIRNWCYRRTAENRYRLMGRKEECIMIQSSRSLT